MIDFLRKIGDWLYKREIIASERNKIIKVKRLCGRYKIVGAGCYQSGNYVDHLWRKLLRKVPKHYKVKNVLLLGMGAGGGVLEIRRRFKKARVVAVEYDPVMVEIAQNTYLRNQALPEVVVNDARVVVKDLKDKFNVVLVDLFQGNKPAKVLLESSFLNNLVDVLDKDGYLLVNFYRSKRDLYPIFDRYFSRWSNLRYWANSLAVYRHFGLGRLGDPLPKSFKDKKQSVSFLKVMINKDRQEEIVGEWGCWGTRKKIGPFIFEHYVSDIEPKIKPFKSCRFISWQPLTGLKGVKRWVTNYLFSSCSQIGVVTVSEGEEYWKNWSNHAIRHRKKWLKNNEYKIEEVEFSKFKKAYRKARHVNRILHKRYLKVIKDVYYRNSQATHFFGVCRLKNQRMLAGMVVIDCDDILQSVQIMSFVDEKAKGLSAGVGLVDYWYRHAINKGLKYLNFGLVWRKGDPRSWKGFSEFKKQFNLYLIVYPKSKLKVIFS